MQAGWLAPEAGSALAKGSSLVVELLPLLLSNPLFTHLDCQYAARGEISRLMLWNSSILSPL